MNFLVESDAVRESVERVVDTLSAYLDADAVFVTLQDGTQEEVLAARNRARPLIEPGSITMPAGPRDHRVLYVPDACLDVALAPDCRSSRKSLVASSVETSDGRIAGHVGALAEPHRPFSERARRLVGTMAAFLAGVMDLARHAYTDGLTGTYTRDAIPAYLEYLKRRGTVSGVGLLFLDLDNFKRLNDLAGHDTGDRVLAVISDALTMIMRAEDGLVVRFGGDEFILLAPLPDLAGAAEMLDHLTNQVSEAIPHSASLVTSLSIAASIGATWQAGLDTLDPAIHDADAKMYRQKAHRRLGAG